MPPPITLYRAWRVVGAALATASVAGAQDTAEVRDSLGAAKPTEHAVVTPEPGKPPERSLESILAPWTVRIDPHVWWVSPSGSIKLPASSSGAASNGDSVRVERLNLDSPRLSPYLEAQINADPWRFSLSGGSFSLDRGHTTADSAFQLGDMPVSIGDSLAVSFDFTTVEASAGYRFWRHDFKASSRHPEDAWDTVVSTYVVGGVRLEDVNAAVRLNNPPVGGVGSVASHQVFVEPFAGIRLEAELARHFGVDFQLTGGGFADSDKSSITIDVAVAFAWRPWDNVGVQIGWRQLAFTLKDGHSPQEFEYSGRMAGVFAGVTIRF